MPDKILVTEEAGGWLRKGGWYEMLADEFGEAVTSYTDYVRHIKEFKLVMFTGGADVDPTLYGETSPYLCSVQKKRDFRERAVFRLASQNNIKMTGICRGLQFCHVMAGGKLLHHLNGHEGRPHGMGLSFKRKPIAINSYHHQMVVPNDHTHVIGWSLIPQSERYVGNEDIPIEYGGLEIEAAIIPSVNFAGVQYHPELLFESAAAWKLYVKLVKDHLELDMGALVAKYPARKRNSYAINLRPRNDIRPRRAGFVSPQLQPA